VPGLRDLSKVAHAAQTIQMKRLVVRFLVTFFALFTALVALVAILFWFPLPKHYVPMLSARAPDRTTAAICAYRENLNGQFGADLVIRSATGQLLQKTNLLRSRDAIEDFPNEFSGLEYTSNAFQLISFSNHYHGPTVFTLNR
jgi:hypothetical protein